LVAANTGPPLATLRVMDSNRFGRTAALALLTVAGAVGVGVLLVRAQIRRSRRDLFSPHPLRRLAALEYLGGAPASVDTALLLRDYVAWERRPLLRRRALTVLARLEHGLDVAKPPEVA
jgi:hypothetical protein